MHVAAPFRPVRPALPLPHHCHPTPALEHVSGTRPAASAALFFRRAPCRPAPACGCSTAQNQHKGQEEAHRRHMHGGIHYVHGHLSGRGSTHRHAGQQSCIGSTQHDGGTWQRAQRQTSTAAMRPRPCPHNPPTTKPTTGGSTLCRLPSVLPRDGSDKGWLRHPRGVSQGGLLWISSNQMQTLCKHA
eukprot:360465-Chlamydomonas_euryale.AAC.12